MCVCVCVCVGGGGGGGGGRGFFICFIIKNSIISPRIRSIGVKVASAVC